jgi:hypothetical protein
MIMAGAVKHEGVFEKEKQQLSSGHLMEKHLREGWEG